jgi:hypothetical protein
MIILINEENAFEKILHTFLKEKKNYSYKAGIEVA